MLPVLFLSAAGVALWIAWLDGHDDRERRLRESMAEDAARFEGLGR